MNNLNLFLWFTSCDWFCKFCEKWNNLVYFWNQDFYYVNEDISFIYLENEIDFKNIVSKKYNDFTTINISWYEPLKFTKLYNFIKIIKKNNPNSILVLKTSWLVIIDQKYYDIFDKIELSIYSTLSSNHNDIVWNNLSWNLLNLNLNNCLNYWFKNKVFFQTILISSNKNDLLDIIKFAFNYNDNYFKIIYPRFIPKNNFCELLWKKEALKLVLSFVPKDYYKNIILNNFLINQKLEKYFYQVCI